MVKEKKKKRITHKQKKGTWTFFTLLFPSLLLGVLLTFPRSIELSFIGALLFFYQAVLLKNFIERFYENSP